MKKSTQISGKSTKMLFVVKYYDFRIVKNTLPAKNIQIFGWYNNYEIKNSSLIVPRLYTSDMVLFDMQILYLCAWIKFSRWIYNFRIFRLRIFFSYYTETLYLKKMCSFYTAALYLCFLYRSLQIDLWHSWLFLQKKVRFASFCFVLT